MRYRYCCLLLFALLGALAQAQEITGSLVGTVKDQSGSVVSGAMVTAKQVDTNASRSVKTSDNGDFSITLLPPGLYSVQVEHPGFETYQRNGMQLEVGQRASLDISLSVGATSQRVEVTEALPSIQTEDSSIGKVIDSATIVNTPTNSRVSLVGLMTMAPGVQITALQDSIPYTGVTMQLNGANAYGAIDFTIDGATNTSPYLERGYGEFPPFDGIKEFKVITSGANAEFGKPNQVVIVTKGGTNQFHGTLLEFNRNRFLAAKSFFAESLPNPAYNRNEFGGNFSGPVLIPKLYDGKDKTFFFVNFEGFRRAQSQTVSSQMPTVAERNGVFTGVGTVLDPTSRAPLPGDTILPSQMNPVALKMLQLYPLPNLAGAGTNLVQNVPVHEQVNRTALRFDHSLTSKDQVNGSYQIGLLGPNPVVGATASFGGYAAEGEHNNNVSLGWTHILSPTAVSEMRATYMHVRIFRTPQNFNLDLSYIPGLGAQAIPGVPTISITNITNMSEVGSQDLDQTFQWVDNVTKTHASHTFKFGVSYLHSDHWNQAVNTPARGGFNFNGQYSGVAFGDLLLGDPSSTQLPVPSANVSRFRQNRVSFYAQDDWKVTPSLTVNYGIRYDAQWMQPNSLGQNSLFVPGLNEMVVFAKSYPQTTLPQLLNGFPTVLASQVGMSSNITDYLGQDLNNVAPRLGLAYRLGQKTVMRAALGMFYNMIPTGDSYGPYSAQLPFATTETFSQPSGHVPGFTLNNPFPGSGAVPANPAVSAESAPVTPYTLQWNYTIERSLPGDVGFRVSYVGQHNVKQNNNHAAGSGLNTTPDLNAPVPAPGNPQLLRPIQPFSTISLNQAPLFQSHMNSLQVGAQKRFSKGVSLNAEYQHTRVIGTQGSISPFDWNDSVGNAGNIRTDVLIVSYSYGLPFGKGQLLANNVPNWADKLVDGWVLSGVTTVESGLPFSTSFSTSVQGSVSGRPNVIAGANLYPANQTIAQWFNPAAFQTPANYTYGNSAYDMLWGPGVNNWDFSLAKNTRFRERLDFQLRLDAFSAFNHPLFANPSASISNPSTVGKITSTVGGNRTIQIGAKFRF